MSTKCDSGRLQTIGRLLFLTATLAVVGVLPACTYASAADLTGTTWVLELSEELQGSALVPVEVTLEFVSGDSVQGVYGFNKYAGSYAVDGERISFDDVCWTTMACMAAAGTLDREQAYVFALEKAGSYVIDGDRLTIDCGDKVLVFKRRQSV